jgi:hypothetical protein
MVPAAFLELSGPAKMAQRRSCCGPGLQNPLSCAIAGPHARRLDSLSRYSYYLRMSLREFAAHRRRAFRCTDEVSFLE